MDGGGHESGVRSGTLNVPGIVGFGAACAIAQKDMEEDALRLRDLRDGLLHGLQSGLEGVSVNGSMEHRLPHNLNLSFAGVDSEALLAGLHDVALSSGSACTSATIQPSHVLKALGLSDERAHSSLRFGLGRWNTMEEIDRVIARLLELVPKLRALSPVAG
jgi:cysteine desulfurase